MFTEPGQERAWALDLRDPRGMLIVRRAVSQMDSFGGSSQAPALWH